MDPEVPGVFTLFVIFCARPAQTWCTIPRKTLFLRFLCTKSGSLFGERPARIWCTIPRKTLFLRFPCTKFGCHFGDRPARRRPSGIRSHHYKSQRERIDDERPISPPSSSILIISSCPCSNLHSTSQKLTTDPRFSAVCRQSNLIFAPLPLM